MKAIVIASLAAACSAAYHGDVDTVLASHHSEHVQAAPPEELAPQPGKAGQWALYRTADRDGEVGYQLVAITRGRCGIWLEVVWGTATHRTVSKTCYRAMPDFAARTKSWEGLLAVAVTQLDADDPVIVDLRDPDGRSLAPRLQLARFHAVFDSARWRHEDLPREDVDVPAGRFARAVRATSAKRAITSWFHPEVPITGLVESRSDDGARVELVAFGQDGATSAVADLPDERVPYVECRPQEAVGHLIWRTACRRKQPTLEDDTQLKNMIDRPVAQPMRTVL
jgi:hypothetical protein